MLSASQIVQNHHYRLGYEVLRDMYALAACDGLVAGLSQVVNCARIVKESSGEEYDTLCIINNGINVKRKTVREMTEVEDEYCNHTVE